MSLSDYKLQRDNLAEYSQLINTAVRFDNNKDYNEAIKNYQQALDFSQNIWKFPKDFRTRVATKNSEIQNRIKQLTPALSYNQNSKYPQQTSPPSQAAYLPPNNFPKEVQSAYPNQQNLPTFSNSGNYPLTYHPDNTEQHRRSSSVIDAFLNQNFDFGNPQNETPLFNNQKINNNQQPSYRMQQPKSQGPIYSQSFSNDHITPQPVLYPPFNNQYQGQQIMPNVNSNPIYHQNPPISSVSAYHHPQQQHPYDLQQQFSHQINTNQNGAVIVNNHVYPQFNQPNTEHMHNPSQPPLTQPNNQNNFYPESNSNQPPLTQPNNQNNFYPESQPTSIQQNGQDKSNQPDYQYQQIDTHQPPNQEQLNIQHNLENPQVHQHENNNPQEPQIENQPIVSNQPNHQPIISDHPNVENQQNQQQIVNNQLNQQQNVENQPIITDQLNHQPIVSNHPNVDNQLNQQPVVSDQQNHQQNVENQLNHQPVVSDQQNNHQAMENQPNIDVQPNVQEQQPQNNEINQVKHQSEHSPKSKKHQQNFFTRLFSFKSKNKHNIRRSNSLEDIVVKKPNEPTQFQQSEIKALQPAKRIDSTPSPNQPPGPPHLLSDIIVQLSDYIIGRCLGSGSFGVVYLCTEKSTGKAYALKQITKPISSQFTEKQLLREIEIMNLARHPLTCHIHGFSLAQSLPSQMPFIVTDYCPNGSLNLVVMRRKRFNNTQKLIALYGIADAMRYLHSINIVHRDLKPENVLFNARDEPIVCDFGLSKLMDSPKLRQTMASGSPVYMAPELMRRQDYTSSIDVYSYAFLTYEVLAERPAFDNIKNIQLLVNTVCEGKRPDLSIVDDYHMPQCFKDFITHSWSDYTPDRPSFAQIVTFFKEGILTLPDVNKDEFNQFVESLSLAGY